MFFVILGMLLTLVLAAVVLALVAVPARRQGREVLSAHGEELVNLARERTTGAVDAARDRVGDLADRLPIGPREAGRGREQHDVDPLAVQGTGDVDGQPADRTADPVVDQPAAPGSGDPVIDVREPHLRTHPPVQ